MLVRLLLIASIPAVLTWGASQGKESEKIFSHDTIHFGIVVSDLDAAAKFYTEGLGFTESEGFQVPATMCTDAGLTDNQPLTVRVFVTDETNEAATRVKLMEVPGVESKISDSAFIHTQLGFSYLTIKVRNLDVSLERLWKLGGKPLAKGPVRLGAQPDSAYLALVRDPDGNLIELIGPKW